MTPPATAHRLHALFAPKSVAIVGASERNLYSNLATQSLQRVGFPGELHMINRGGQAYGKDCIRTIAELAEPVDTAYLCVPGEAVNTLAAEAIDRGIRNLVIVSSGFREVGGEGVQRERELLELCARTGTQVLGPNCLGYINFLSQCAVGSIAVHDQPANARIALISNSGSVAGAVNTYGVQQGIGFTHIIATGNEMNVTMADIIDYLVDVPEVAAVAVFMEMVSDSERFAAAALKAKALHKPIVVLKAGASEATAAVAAAHTGALIGDNRVFDTACERYGLVRVATFELLAVTAATLAETGPISPPGVGFVSISGGVAEVASDLAESCGVAMPVFAESTRAELSKVLSNLGQMHNPIDLTGAAVRDQSMFETVPEIISRDPAIGLVVVNWDLPIVAEPSMAETLARIPVGMKAASTPALLMGNFNRPINEHGRAYMERHGLNLSLPGLSEGVAALGKLVWWSERALRDEPNIVGRTVRATTDRPSTEKEALAHLAKFGVPVIAFRLVTNRDAAEAAAREIGEPVAIKILSPDIAHKSEAGGVALDLRGPEAVGAAYDAMMKTVAQRRPDARLEGVLVSPMRTGGLELIVGVSRDPQWGLVMALGVGGIWVEALNDSALCLLPTSAAEVRRAFGRLRAAKLLGGFRGAPPVDMDVLAEVVLKIGDAAMALGPDLAALEINPLFVSAHRIEALDALAVWAG